MAKKTKEKNLIWIKFRKYIDFMILVCCIIITFNIHPNKNNSSNNNLSSDESKMTYIFHDYEWNKYIMNENIHGSTNSRDYLFSDSIPNDLMWNEKEYPDWAPLNDYIEEINNQNSNNIESWENSHQSDSIKDNQITINDIMSDLWLDTTTGSNGWTGSNTKELIISIGDIENNDDSIYSVDENDNNSLIIQKIDNNQNEKIDNKDKTTDNDNLLNAKVFTFVEEGWILPTLVSRNDLFNGNNSETIAYTQDSVDNPHIKKWWITIIEEYASCMTPRWYKINHWESVLAYKQIESAPNICNIERRFCWKWKLSWTYTKQWCSVNKNYSYEEWWNVPVETNKAKDEVKWVTIQNTDWSVSIVNNNAWNSTNIDRANTYTDFGDWDNIRPEDQEVEQTSRPYPWCTAPWWEKIKHGHFIQAFKHANWFSDAPCELQIRLCSVWELMWTYTEPTCKTWDTSFIDWVNGSPSRQTYSKEKIDLVKKQIAAEKEYYKNTRNNTTRSTNSEALDRILYILDQD